MVLSALPFVCPRVPWSSSLDPTIANTEEIYTWYMDIHGNMLVMGNITNYGIPSRQKLDDIPSSSGMVTHFYQDLYIYIYIHSARILTVGWPQSTTCWPWLPTKQKGFNHRKQRFYRRQCWLTQLQGVALISLLTRNAQLILFRLTIGFIVDIVDGVNIKPRNITRRHLNIWELTSKSNNWNTKNVGMSSWYVI